MKLQRLQKNESFYEFKNQDYSAVQDYIRRVKAIDKINLSWPFTFPTFSFDTAGQYIRYLRALDSFSHTLAGENGVLFKRVYACLYKAEGMSVGSRQLFIAEVIAEKHYDLAEIAKGFLSYLPEKERQFLGMALDDLNSDSQKTPEYNPEDSDEDVSGASPKFG